MIMIMLVSIATVIIEIVFLNLIYII
jgi:hypothetical protein